MKNVLKPLLLAYLLVLTGVCAVYAQTNNSIVHYQDGSVFIGDILSSGNSQVKLKLSTGDTVSLHHEKITKMFTNEQVIVYSNGKFHNISGFFAFGSVAFNTGYNRQSAQLDGTIGYRINRKISIGAGLGIDSHVAFKGGSYMSSDFCSLFGYGRYFINDRRFRLFAESKMGWGFPVNMFMEEESGGLLVQPGIGVLIPSRNKFRWFFALNFCMQSTGGERIDFDAFSQPVYTTYSILYHRPVFRVGLQLN